jgi:hypothetical protein
MAEIIKKLKESLYKEYKDAMVYIEVVSNERDLSIGSGFHLGEGVIITAKHVLENKTIKSLSYGLKVESGPYFHNNESVDLAAIVVDRKDLLYIPLGGHLDDWINNEDFMLAQTIIMGYPPIPFSAEPLLVAATAEINAIVDRYNGPHPHFIISAMPRGGFSGGACLVEWGDCLGVIVQSFGKNYEPTELGFMAVITVEPIFDFLHQNKILPQNQINGWEDIYSDD